MRWFLHLAGFVLLVVAAVLTHWTVDGSTLADAMTFAFAGLACWCVSTLPPGPPS